MTFQIDPRRVKAVLFDVDGTLAETEAEGHLPAFNDAFARLGIPWVWSLEDYAWLLETTGGYERMQTYARARGELRWLMPEGLATLKRAHLLKNQLYGERLARGLVSPRQGLSTLMQSLASAGIPWIVVTTTSQSNWSALWSCCLADRLPAPPLFTVCGEDVARKKPDPEAYVQAASRLGLSPSDCLAIEDSPNGLKSALAAGVPCVIVKSLFFKDLDFAGAVAVEDEHLSLGVSAPV